MPSKAEIKKLEDKIAEETDETVKKALEAELAKLTGEAEDEYLLTEMTPEGYEQASVGASEFPVPGEWVALFGKPFDYSIENPDSNTICFPFTVPAPGYTASFERDDRIWASPRPFEQEGKQAKSKLKAILNALGVATDTDPKSGMFRFKPSDCEGKVAKVIYRIPADATYEDALTGEMKPSTIAKAVWVVPLSDKAEAEEQPPF